MGLYLVYIFYTEAEIDLKDLDADDGYTVKARSECDAVEEAFGYWNSEYSTETFYALVRRIGSDGLVRRVGSDGAWKRFAVHGEADWITHAREI